MPCKFCCENDHSVTECLFGLIEMQPLLHALTRKSRNTNSHILQDIRAVLSTLPKHQLKLLVKMMGGSVSKTKRELEEYCIEYFEDVRTGEDDRFCIQLCQEVKPPTTPSLTEEDCPICFNPCGVKTSCEHSFCGDCILKHIAQNGVACPMCRQEVDSLVHYTSLSPSQKNKIRKMTRNSDDFYFKRVSQVVPMKQPVKQSTENDIVSSLVSYEFVDLFMDYDD